LQVGKRNPIFPVTVQRRGVHLLDGATGRDRRGRRGAGGGSLMANAKRGMEGMLGSYRLGRQHESKGQEMEDLGR